MRDPARIPKVTQELQKYWDLMPDLRLWQVMSILENEVKRTGKDPFYVEDDQWLDIINALLRKEAENPTYINCPQKK